MKESARRRTFVYRLIVGVIWNVLVFGGLLFLPARTLHWWRAWVFLGVVFVGTVATMVGVFAADTGLLDERLKPPIQKGQPLVDKVVLPLFIAAFFGWIVLIPLDVFRFHLIGKPAPIVSFLGLGLFIAGWWIISLSFKENAFAAPVVRHQEEPTTDGHRYRRLQRRATPVVHGHRPAHGRHGLVVGIVCRRSAREHSDRLDRRAGPVRGTVPEAGAARVRSVYASSPVQTDPVDLVDHVVQPCESLLVSIGHHPRDDLDRLRHA